MGLVISGSIVALITDKKRGADMKRILPMILCFVLILSLFASCATSDRHLSAAELLDLGEKYLIELNYDQALVQFLRVIEVEPKNARAYTGAAEAYIGLGDTDRAVAILRQGLAALPGNAEIQVLFDDLQLEISTADTESTHLDNERQELLILEAEEILTEFASLISSGNPEMVSDRLIRMELNSIASELSEAFGLPYIIDTQYGRIGAYQALLGESLDFWIYQGGFSDEVREGFGIWIGRGSVAEGTWRNDAPNGVFEQRSGGNPQLWTSTGNVINGLWDGERTTAVTNSGEGGSDGVFIMQFDSGRIETFIDERNGQVLGAVDAHGNPTLGISEESMNQLWGLRGFGENTWG
jgi:hypothetical protein